MRITHSAGNGQPGSMRWPRYRRGPQGYHALDMLDADAAIIRRTAAPHRDDVMIEIAAEYRTFKRAGPQFPQALDVHGRVGTATLRNAMTVLSALDGDWCKPRLADVPLGHLERRW